MKPARTPASHHLLKSATSIACNTLKRDHKLPLHTIVSHFLGPAQTPFSSLNSQNNEPTDTHIIESSIGPKSINKSISFHLVPPPNPPNDEFGNTHLPKSSHRPKPTSSKHQNNDLFHTHLVDSKKKSKANIKSTSNYPVLFNYSQARSFSAAPSDPFPKPIDTMEPNSSPSNSIPVVSTITSSPFESSPPIDAGSSIRKPISLWPGMYHSPVTNALWEARSSIFERQFNATGDAPLQTQLITKTPSQSRTSILYKFSSDYILREQYRNPWNEIRIGKLLEDLDALAGTISFKHCSSNDSTTRPLLLVTASVDKMVLRKPIRIGTDVKIVGAVTWVGRSSMEIQLEVTQTTEGYLCKIIISFFTAGLLTELGLPLISLAM
ncbi:unnamed protein product [Ilex paraguariensis]|uniref:HotDog ACOT-type domain-containing protein n=1 Tax=Ilex paraguariensis TaxID=185542 RepID=A0ABC8UQB6_9AQUA